MNKKILIIDEMHPSILPLLEDLGYQTDYLPLITEKEVFDIISQYEGLIVRSKIFIGKEILEKAINLKFIGRAGAGLDQIIEEEVLKKGIKLLNAPEGNRDAVAEHVIGMLLCLMNNMNISDAEIRAGKWLREANRGYEIGGKTVSIIGYGNNGKALAKRLKSFNCKVLAIDILDRKLFEDENAEAASWDKIFEQTDIISFHIPLTSATDKLVNKDFLSKFKKKIWLLNASRGQVLVLKDLLEAIENEKVYGAGLDVLEIENLQKFEKLHPNEFKKLMNNKKILLTPHVAGWTFESYFKINEALVAKIKQLT